MLLYEEVQKSFKRPNFITVINQAFESGTRKQLILQDRKFPDNFIEIICQAIRLSPIQSVAFALALAQSKNASIYEEAIKIIKSLLPTINGNFLADINEEILRALVNFTMNHKELSHPDVYGKFINTLRLMQQQRSAAITEKKDGGMNPVEISQSTLRNTPTSDLQSVPQQRTSIASRVMERGSQCSQSKELFRAVLAEIGLPITEDQLAMLIIALVNRILNINTPPEVIEADKLQDKWNLENIVDVLATETRNLNWTAVVSKFDQPYLMVRTEQTFLFIVRIFVRLSGGPLPAAGLLGNWNNKQSQLAMLVLGANSPRTLVDFSGIVSADQQLPPEVPVPNNYSWLSIPLYSTLLHLANSGLSADVLEALSNALGNFPEYVTLSLAQVPQEQNNGIRVEILRRSLPLFSGLSGSRPTFPIVMKRLIATSPELLIYIFRYALKNAKKIQDIIDTDSRLKSFGPILVRKIDEDSNLDEILGYWCVKADRSDFNLDAKLSLAIESNPTNARIVYNFAKLHVENLRPRQSDGGVLSIESFTSLLRAIQQYPSVVSTEEVRTLATIATQHQQLAHSKSQQLMQQHSVGSVSAIDSSSIEREGNIRNSEAEDIEEEANQYFQKIYTSDISVSDVIGLLKRFKTSTEKREQEIFRCMIHNLFDEYRFFHKYPDKELNLTGVLFGSLIQHQLVSTITLGIALRYIIEALRKDPEQVILVDKAGTNEKQQVNNNEKFFRFAKIALEQCRSRLREWPQYCSHLIQIPHLRKHCPDLFDEAERILGNAPVAGSMTRNVSDSTGNSSAINQQLANMTLNDSKTDSQSSMPLMSENNVNLTSNDIIQATSPEVLELSSQRALLIERMTTINVDNMNTVLPPEQIRDKMHMIVNNVDKSNILSKSQELKLLVTSEYYSWFANYLVVKRISAQPNLHHLYVILMDSIDNGSEFYKVILDSTYHNATKLLLSPKITSNSTERTLLRNLGIWLGLITLARNKPLLHRRVPVKELLCWGYENGRLIAVCSFVARLIEGVKESQIFRLPNPWLMGILSLLRELYEVEDLKMNIKFEVQVLCNHINLKIDDIPKTNILSKCRIPIKDGRNPDFNVKNVSSVVPAVAVVPSSNIPIVNGTSSTPVPAPIATPSPILRSVSDANISDEKSDSIASAAPSLMPPMSLIPQSIASTPTTSTPTPQEQTTVIPNLAQFIVINPSIQYFATNPAQRRIVSIAVDRGIRELIQSVAERSVTIASVTTKQLITKDFVTEGNEQQLRKYAHMMIANISGSLALVTCKEPLRLSICNHLRSLLAQSISDQNLIEQIVQVCSNDNLEIGCKLIEKAATEKAIRDADESLTMAFQLRRKSREAGSSNEHFIDPTVSNGAIYPRELPDALKPRIEGLSQLQLQMYEGFSRMKLPTAVTANVTPSSIAPVSANATVATSSSLGIDINAIVHSNANLPPISMQQALEGYQQVYGRIDNALRGIQSQSQGREVSIANLGNDHEIFNFLREIIVITQRAQVTIRNDTALTFAENIVKKALESLNIIDNLRLEVIVGILEALRDVTQISVMTNTPNSKKLSVELIVWLNNYSTFNVSEDNVRKMLRTFLVLLLRVKLLKSQDIDSYFSVFMDSGRDMTWVELALSFVKQCLSDNLAATYEFASIFDTVSKIRPANANVRKQLQTILTDLRTLATSKEEQEKQQVNNVLTNSPSAADVTAREHVTMLLEKWLRIWTSINEPLFAQYLQLMHQYGVLKTEESADRFFRISTEVCVEACLKQNATDTNQTSSSSPTLNYTVVDALSKLFMLLMRLADKESTDASVRVNLLGRILQAISKVLLDDHETKQSSNSLIFDQRPYFRFLSNLLQELGIPDIKKEVNMNLLPILVIYFQIFTSLQPNVAPGFVFGWLQLISHKCFLPNLLLLKGQKGWPYIHKLLQMLLQYQFPFLKNPSQLNEPIRKLYKGSIRVFLMILHDFPEFLCEYQLPLCDSIPITSIQLRNLVLAAFPRNIKIPDPFSSNLKIDLLPEISQTPRIFVEYFTTLVERGIKQRIDAFITTRQPSDVLLLLPRIVNVNVEVNQSTSSSNMNASLLGVDMNSQLLNSCIVYIGGIGAAQMQQKVPIQSSPSIDLFKALLNAYDQEGKYLILSFMANQLRYPNSHTHYFSTVLLYMFLESDNELIQEQITRVLLERLIVHRPHPVSISLVLYSIVFY